MLAGTMILSLTACGKGAGSGKGQVELTVTTTFAGEDTNAQNYKDAYQAWEKETGNKVVDTSASSDETFKARILKPGRNRMYCFSLTERTLTALSKRAKWYPLTRSEKSIRNMRTT